MGARHDSFAVAASDSALILLRLPAAAVKAPALLAVVQLRGGGSVDVQSTDIAPHLGKLEARAWECLLSTEEARFCPDPVPVVTDLSKAAPNIHFSRPAALILRALSAGPLS